jgi:hypothetical protein
MFISDCLHLWCVHLATELGDGEGAFGPLCIHFFPLLLYSLAYSNIP